MFPVLSKNLFAALALFVMSALLLTGCAATPAAYAIAEAAATTTAATTAPTSAPGAPTVAATTVAASTDTATSKAAPAQGAAADATRTITVVGRGEVTGKPDVARSSIGIEVMAPTVAEASKQAQARMDAVLKALKAQGIADKDVQTSNYSITFERQNQGAPSPASSTGSDATQGVYRVNNMVNVTIRDLAKVGSVIDAAVGAGANNVWGITFGLDDTTAQETQAREKAVADARARAQTLAELNGVNLGGVVSISEVIGSPITPKYDMAAQGLGGGGTPVEPGEVTFSTQIQIVYAIQ